MNEYLFLNEMLNRSWVIEIALTGGPINFFSPESIRPSTALLSSLVQIVDLFSSRMRQGASLINTINSPSNALCSCVRVGFFKGLCLKIFSPNAKDTIEPVPAPAINDQQFFSIIWLRKSSFVYMVFLVFSILDFRRNHQNLLVIIMLPANGIMKVSPLAGA